MPQLSRMAAAFDRALLQWAPGWAASRAQHRIRAVAYRQAYEAAEATHLRGQAREAGSGNAIVSLTGTALRNQARHLDRNHDIISGGLSTLVQNIIGPSGINIVPTPRDADGNVVESVVDQIMPLYQAWAKRPEVTWMHDWASVQRLLARTWLRDGEAFAQELRGFVPFLEHGSAVPFSLELMEPDLVPLDLDDSARRILQGVERNAWGRAVAFHVYKQHPGDAAVFRPETKRVSADLIRHVRTIDRIGQVRGVSILASTFTRIEDLKDYEESERIAAKIAASMAAVIIKGDPTLYDAEGFASAGKRKMRFQPGMVFDDLRPGESVQSIDSKRPNPNLEPYRNGQLRAIAAPMRISFSSLSKNYNGTYSAQRQELVEQYGAYGVLAYEFVSQMVRPVYERLIAMAVVSGELVLPPGVTLASAIGADYLPPPMPWINPVHEMQGISMAVRGGVKSLSRVIAERGDRMYDTLEQIAIERRWAEDLGIILDTDPRQVSAAGLTQARAPGSRLATEPNEEEEQQ
ncbi:phage portal protein [Pseudoxanthomonas sp. LH2527]|uniref:phage portal protein n=1 Tax=Pseudoxanthomonas sp. LH2527 TaxID=2923249 RepID=UPI001F143BFF|nr:phage portal protein [Pseudoxanthomonas sp. LH2527]MCH6484252.1 phage portal protein [Pseudoxanthomonas sp. LH2527]